MRDYRLYLMDPEGHILSALELECADDDEALARADAKRGVRPAELWERARKIQAFSAKTDAQP